MLISRIDDADRIHVTYRRLTSNVLLGYGALAIFVFFVTLVAYAFIIMESDGGRWLIAVPFILAALIIGFGVYKEKRNRSYFQAYIMDGGSVVHVDFENACGSNALFGEPSFPIRRRGIADRIRLMSHMKKVPSTSYYDEFVSREDVMYHSGSLIDRVISMEDKGRYIKLRAHMKRLDTSAVLFTERVRTLYIPLTFTNTDELRRSLERLM